MHTNSSTTSSISADHERFVCCRGAPGVASTEDGEDASVRMLADAPWPTASLRSASSRLLPPLPRTTASVLPRTAAGRIEPAPSHGSGACVVVTSQFGCSTPVAASTLCVRIIQLATCSYCCCCFCSWCCNAGVTKRNAQPWLSRWVTIRAMFLVSSMPE